MSLHRIENIYSTNSGHTIFSLNELDNLCICKTRTIKEKLLSFNPSLNLNRMRFVSFENDENFFPIDALNGCVVDLSKNDADSLYVTELIRYFKALKKRFIYLEEFDFDILVSKNLKQIKIDYFKYRKIGNSLNNLFQTEISKEHDQAISRVMAVDIELDRLKEEKNNEIDMKEFNNECEKDFYNAFGDFYHEDML
jgi:hypothetical protein